SNSLQTVEWGKWDPPTLIKGNLAQELRRLKEQTGKDIGTAGSPGLVRSLLQEGLLDELRLLVSPIVVGKGMRLFQDGEARKKLKLLASRSSRTGALILTYQPE